MLAHPLIKPVLASAIVLFLSACSPDSAVEKTVEAPVLKPVRTMIVSGETSAHRGFTGVVDAAQTAELGFRVSGELSVVHIKEGDQVLKGQVLAELDQADFRISLNAAQADFDRAEAEFNRAAKLLRQNAVSRADYDKLKAQLSAARAKLDKEQQNLNYTVLKAPFDGVIAKRYKSNFEKYSASEKFAALQDLSAFEVKVDIPESVMIRIKRDLEPQVFAVFDGNEAQPYSLTFKEVSTRADEKTQNYTVTFVMPAPAELNLLPGMSARVYAVNPDQTTSDDIYVPAHAVLEDSAGRFLYVALPDGAGQARIQRRSVVVGGINENGLNIVQGLAVGEHVVTAGMSKMSEGLKVRLMDEGL